MAKTSDIGLVLSGGGARGAYEAGVMLYIAETLPELLDRTSIISGASVGAVNSVFLASRRLTPQAVRDLVQLWYGLEFEKLLSVSHRSVMKTLSLLTMQIMKGGLRTPARGILNAEPLFKLVEREVDWQGLRNAIDSARFRAVMVAGTDIATGQTHLFADGPNLDVQSKDFQLRPVRLQPAHVSASAAIPVLFTPIQVDGRWYMDGGVRYNTPLSPALHAGAQALIVISVRGSSVVTEPSERTPSLGQILGKVLDSIFLDRATYDMDRLCRINDVVEIAESSGGGEAFRAELKQRGRRPYRYVPVAAVQPTQDLGALAGQELTRMKGGAFLRLLADVLGGDDANSADAASFLLFDGAYAKVLVEAGYADARRSHAALAQL